MGGGDQEGVEAEPGGIKSLAEFVTEHREAVQYDLLTRTGYDLDDVGRGLSWTALDSFIKNTPPDGAIMRELRPELSQWSTTAKTNALLADIYDLLAAVNANLCAKGSGKKAKRPKPYPRPGAQSNVRKIGKALPVDELKRRIFGRDSGGED